MILDFNKETDGNVIVDSIYVNNTETRSFSGDKITTLDDVRIEMKF